MEKRLEFEVKFISNEKIKPSTPTPTNLKTYGLSLLDQNFPALHIPILLFYYTGTTKQTPALDIMGLKSSLSETLAQFYPLAGRCMDDESTISCNDEGIPFLETHVDYLLTDFISSPNKLDLLTKFLPPRDLLALGPRPISELVPLAFQVNVFACNGVVIGCYMLHKLLDAASLGTFLKYWAALASKRFNNLVHPDFNAIVKAFPPCPMTDQVLVPDLCNNPEGLSQPITVVAKSFLFNRAAITDLRTKAASELVPKPTRFEAVAGFVWEQMFITASTAACLGLGVLPGKTTLSISANMRARVNPPLPKGSMGNLVTNVHASAEKWGGLPALVMSIHAAVSKVQHKIQTFQGENGAEVLRADRIADSLHVMEYKASSYQISSWCNLGLEEADFGFGKPKWIIPTEGRLPPSLRNFIFFTDYTNMNDENGIEVWLFLEEKEMQRLEANKLFFTFASPN